MKKSIDIAGLRFVKMGAGYQKEKFYNQEKNNLIVIRPFDGLSTENVLNQLADAPMEHLYNSVLECENIVVEISAIETTTSDFRIFIDLGAEKVKELSRLKHNKLERFLDNIYDKSAGEKSYKHTFIFDGDVVALRLNQTRKNIGENLEPRTELYKGTENGYVIAHINGNILDNRAENLQWVKVC